MTSVWTEASAIGQVIPSMVFVSTISRVASVRCIIKKNVERHESTMDTNPP